MGCSLPVSTAAARRNRSAALTPSAGKDPATSGMPSVSVPVLSKAMALDVGGAFQGFDVTDQNAGPGRGAGACDQCSRGWRARARTGMRSPAPRRPQPLRFQKSAPASSQPARVRPAITSITGTNTADIRSTSFLDRSLAGLGFLDEAGHAGKTRVGADRPDFDFEHAVGVGGAGDDRFSGASGHRHAFTGHHGLIKRGLASR
jgi:hypothetical protein